MTEDEAKQKWCPFSRTLITGGNQMGYMANRLSNSPDGVLLAGTRCIGSACMMFVKRSALVVEDGVTVKKDEYHCGLIKQVW